MFAKKIEVEREDKGGKLQLRGATVSSECVLARGTVAVKVGAEVVSTVS